VRAFALVALVGGLAAEIGGAIVSAVCGGFIALLGALTCRNPALAAGLAVVVTVLLAARSPLDRFVRDSLSPRELHDGVMFAAAAPVVLPLVRAGPLGSAIAGFV
jgi:uncharacterized membrane protein (DUF4010 family)